MNSSAAVQRAAPRRHVHLGDRLAAIARIRSGALSVKDAARSFGVQTEDVRRWLTLHAGERIVTLEELRGRRTPRHVRLEQRADRLLRLVAEAEHELRGLEKELASKQLGEKSHESAPRVVCAQPKPAETREFVDGAFAR